MSFIFAEKTSHTGNGKQDTIKVYCDTKLLIDDRFGAGVSVKLQQQMLKYGMVKSTIICPEFCISFAGNNIFLASKLFAKLYELKTFYRKDVLREAYQIHKTAADASDIEFIISSAEKGELIVDCIKEKKIVENQPSAWIGSYEAFRYMQGYRHKDDEPVQRKSLIAFQKTVESGFDDTVGGFPISAEYFDADKSFKYVEEYRFVSNKENLVPLGEEIKLNTSAQEGGMSYRIIPMGLGSILLSIDQMDNAILFSRGHRYDNAADSSKRLFGLMLPMEIYEAGSSEWKCSQS